MDLKWLALGLLLAGVCLLALSYLWNKSASFENGSFMGVIATLVVGVLCLGGGAGIIMVKAFMAI